MTAFSFYVLISTYKGLSPKKKLKKVVPVVSGGSSEKQNSTSPVVIEENSIGKGNRKRKRIPRVEVSILINLRALVPVKRKGERVDER